MADTHMQRKLRAIFSADVKGYSKLMGEDDEFTITTITAYRQIITDVIEAHNGHVVDTPGDNILAEFGSALNAVDSALEIQRKLNAENDDLTFRHAAPTDTWLHAQSVPGSHVVLKSPGGAAPPARILEAAASIAAHFSKAKHSGLVPVVYTQRKYVRKFRGAKPGQVKCEREKTMMVEPRLPTERQQ